MKILFALKGTNSDKKGNGAPSAQLREFEMKASEKHMTHPIGQAIRELLLASPSYGAYTPVITASIDGNPVGEVSVPRGGYTLKNFTKVNMEMLRIIQQSRVTTQELLDLSHSKDPFLNGISAVFGHTGKSINVAGAEAHLDAKKKSLMTIIRYAAQSGKELYQSQTPKEVLDWEAKDKEAKRLKLEEKKLLTAAK